MKKGFTLVELLAVIIVLGIISLIAVPRIMDAIEDSRINTFKLNYEIVEVAAKDYFSKNIMDYHMPVGESREVSLPHLIERGLISQVYSPLHRNDCSGYVVITRLETNDYEFTPHLFCGENNNINSSQEDGLILHYTFDDFQEPTENLFPHDGTFDSSSGEHIGNVELSNGNTTILGGGWRCGTHFNDGVCRIEEGGLYGNNKLIWYHNDETGWKGATLTSTYPLEANKTYTMSIKTRINQAHSSSQTAYAFYGPVGYRHYFTWEKQPRQHPGEWVRGTRTFTPDINLSGQVYLYGISNAPNGIVVEYDGYQVEEKPYATPFTKGIREGRVIDRSPNNINSELTMANTPRWIFDEERNSGVYLFNGQNTFINTNQRFDFAKEDSFSVSFWINAKDHTERSGAAAGIVGKGHWYNNTWDLFLLNSNRIRFEISGNPTRDGIRSLTTPVIELETWHHVVATYEAGQARLYFNGEQVASSTYTGDGDFNGARDIRIGTRHTDQSRTLDGMLDDIRIYERVLSPDEILEMYEF